MIVSGRDGSGELPPQGAERALGHDVAHPLIGDEEQPVHRDAGKHEQKDRRRRVAAVSISWPARAPPSRCRTSRSPARSPEERRAPTPLEIARLTPSEIATTSASAGVRSVVLGDSGFRSEIGLSKHAPAGVEHVRERAGRLRGDLRQDPLGRVPEQRQRRRLSVENVVREPLGDRQERRRLSRR